MAESNLPENEKKSTVYRTGVVGGGAPGEHLDQRGSVRGQTCVWLVTSATGLKTLVLIPTLGSKRDLLSLSVYVTERAREHGDADLLCVADSVVRYDVRDAEEISKDPIAALPADPLEAEKP